MTAQPTVENFKLKDQNGEYFDLYENLERRVLLVFYPKDNTAVCSRQLANYQNNLTVFEEYDIIPVGVNTGGVESHRNFCSGLDLSLRLLSDPEGEVSRRFRALNLFGINKRKLVLIGSDRRVLYEKAVLSIRFRDAESIIAELKSLNII